MAGEPRPSPSLAAPLILAAGRGRRAGGNKGLLPIAGTPLVLRHLEALRGLTRHPPLVVTGCEHDRLAPLVLRGGGVPVRNRRWEEGQTSSLKAGLRALPGDASGFLIHPVDHAFARREDWMRILVEFERDPERPGRILRPCAGDARGHPVLFSISYLAEFLALQDGDPGNGIYRRHRERVEFVPVDNPWIGRDVDTVEDAELASRLLARE